MKKKKFPLNARKSYDFTRTACINFFHSLKPPEKNIYQLKINLKTNCFFEFGETHLLKIKTTFLRLRKQKPLFCLQQFTNSITTNSHEIRKQTTFLRTIFYYN